MVLVKRGDAQIIGVIDKGTDVDDEETEKVLEAVKQDAKNISKDGNKSEKVTELNS